MNPQAAPLLEAHGLHTYYGASHVLHGVDFAIARGEVVGLMGRNGMGKSTLIRSMLGFVAPLVAREIWRVIGDLRGHGIAALIVDRNYQAVTAVADRCVILVKGRVVFDGDSEALLARAEFLHRHLGV